MEALAHLDRPVAPLGPDSMLWQIAGKRTALLGAGAALLLQVAHPVVGAGVHDHSDFARRPWDRLERTLDSLYTQIFGGQRAIDESARLRTLHRTITGTDEQGRRYHALQAEAYFWVHATLYLMLVEVERNFGRPLTREQQVVAYAEWRQLGALLGIPDRVMPTDLDSFHRYADDMIANTLTANSSTRQVTAVLALRGVPAPTPLLTPAWALGRPAGRRVLTLSTAGLLPANLRERLDLDWSPRRQAELNALGAIVRRTEQRLPARARYFPMAYRAKTAGRAG
ncbi:oxygenase MpaB family protein [Skermania piniformis]